MRSTKPSEAEQETREGLEWLRERVLATSLSDEDREALAGWWATIEEPIPQPKEVSLGFASALVFPVFDPGSWGLEPRLIPCAVALRAFAGAIEGGLPEAELMTQELLRDCGFEDAAVHKILEGMIARAPQPDPDALN